MQGRPGMVRQLTIFSLALLLFLPGVAAAGPEDEANPRSELEALGWLEGHWRGPADEGVWEAIYSSPEGGLILSLNKQIVDGQLVLFEIEQFRIEDGRVVMAPAPSGRPSPVVFTLTSHDVEARRAVFENPSHDFPQMLTYHRLAEDELRIQIQARREGSLFGFELNLVRQSADSND